MARENYSGIRDLGKLNRWRQYQTTLSFVLSAAAKRVFPRNRLRIEHSMSQGFYCYLDRKIDRAGVARIKQQMTRIIARDSPIDACQIDRGPALNLFRKQGRQDVVELLKNSPLKRISVYKLEDLCDTYMMAPGRTAGVVKNFDLRYFSPGFVLLFPAWEDLSRMVGFMPQPKLSRIFNEYIDWLTILGVANVADLNAAVAKGRGPEIIKVSEALHEKKIVYIADRIKRENRKIVLIAGPSSAGKTTFTKRLAIQLIVNELKPQIVSVDNYFFPHRRTPRDEQGQLDFESIRAVDIRLLNRHLRRIIAKDAVTLPKFDFVTGIRRKGIKMALPENGILLVEGIHCLNEELTYQIPKKFKFKIYISALTQLNVDDHNRISTTDTRMMRRIVRDIAYRGYTPQGVFEHWGSVRKGEERNIYPFQEEADEMFNSALIYEPSILKKFCVPIIKKIDKNNPIYPEARRLLDYFSFFYDLQDRDVPSNSIVREFIGHSSFVY